MKLSRIVYGFNIILFFGSCLGAKTAHAQAVTGPLQAAAIPYEKTESIAATQKKDEWCWAACIQMLAASQNVSLPQEISVQKIYGASLPNLPSQNFSNICRAIDGIYTRSDGSKVRLFPIPYLGNRGFAQPLVDSIKSNRPFIIVIQTHALLAYGVKWADIFNNTGRRIGIQIFEINMIDPMFGYGYPKYVNLPLNRFSTIIGAVTFTAQVLEQKK